MGYVVTDRTPIRTGWRNYKTNPFAAAQMSGLGRLGDVTSATIDPSTEMPGTGMTVAELLAQGFSAADIDTLLSTEVPGTGQSIGALLGLGYSPSDIDTMLQGSAAPAPAATAPAVGVPDGTILNYTGTWVAPFTSSPTTVLQQVSGALSKSGLAVRGSSNDSGTWTALVGGQFNVQMQIQVVTGMGGFASPDDVLSIVRHEVYAATGGMPLADSIPTMTRPSGGTTSTGQPAGPGAAPSSWLAWLQNNFTTVGLLLIAVTVGPSLIDSFGGKRRR